MPLYPPSPSAMICELVYGKFVPRRFPSCVVCGRGRSMRYDEGSFVEGRETRSFHFGIGRSCYHHGCIAFPITQRVSISLQSISTYISSPRCASRFSSPSAPRCPSSDRRLVISYLSWVDLLAGEGIVVSAHIGGCVDCVSCRIRGLPKSLMGEILTCRWSRRLGKVANCSVRS